jgi:hypothetical protein
MIASTDLQAYYLTLAALRSLPCDSRTQDKELTQQVIEKLMNMEVTAEIEAFFEMIKHELNEGRECKGDDFSMSTYI